MTTAGGRASGTSRAFEDIHRGYVNRHTRFRSRVQGETNGTSVFPVPDGDIREAVSVWDLSLEEQPLELEGRLEALQSQLAVTRR
jgi:hypothetical protein